MHRIDARSKLIMLVIYSVCLFFINSWTGLLLAALLLGGCIAVSRVSLKRIFAYVIPVYVIVSFTILFNAFVYVDPSMVYIHAPLDLAGIALGDATQTPVAEDTLRGSFVPFIGDVMISQQGALRGIYIAVRILLLVWASLIVCYTTTSTQLTNVLSGFMKPLRYVRVPVDDIAMVISIALRFIPQVIEEFFMIKDAQWARGASFSAGSLVSRMKAHCVILIPLTVSMFRRADRLAQAMDVRCYGMCTSKSSISAQSLPQAQMAGTVIACALFIVLAVFL